MAIVVNTNVQSIQVQNNLNRVTDAMNTAMERMTTGSKINKPLANCRRQPLCYARQLYAYS